VDTQNIDGQLEGQSEYTDEPQETEGVTSGGTDRYRDLEAKYDMLLDGFEELRGALIQSRQAPVTQQNFDDDMDDDEPVTPSKLKRVVSSAVSSAVSKSTRVNERAMWDQKLATDFPLHDAQFQRELKKTSKELMSAGMDVGHPKALYECARLTARSMGLGSQSKQRAKSDDLTAEAPSRQAEARTATVKTKMVAEDDPRVKFYMSVKGNKDRKAIDKLRTKLAENDTRRKR